MQKKYFKIWRAKSSKHQNVAVTTHPLYRLTLIQEEYWMTTNLPFLLFISVLRRQVTADVRSSFRFPISQAPLRLPEDIFSWKNGNATAHYNVGIGGASWPSRHATWHKNTVCSSRRPFFSFRAANAMKIPSAA